MSQSPGRLISGAIVSLDGLKDIFNTYADVDGGKIGGSATMLWLAAENLDRINESLQQAYDALAAAGHAD